MSKAGTSDWRSRNLRNYNTTVSVGYEFMYLLQLWMYKADSYSASEYYTGDSSCSCSCSCTTCDCDTDDDDLLLSMQVCVACALVLVVSKRFNVSISDSDVVPINALVCAVQQSRELNNSTNQKCAPKLQDVAHFLSVTDELGFRWNML